MYSKLCDVFELNIGSLDPSGIMVVVAVKTGGRLWFGNQVFRIILASSCG
jgi:hypothetical protein